MNFNLSVGLRTSLNFPETILMKRVAVAMLVSGSYRELVEIIGVILGYISGQYWSWRKDRRERLEQEQREQFRRSALEAMKAGKWNTWQDPTDGEAPRG